MGLNDENLRARIIDRLAARAGKPFEQHAAEKRIEEELKQLALAEDEGRTDDIYRHLINLGTCYAVLKKPHETLEYFKRAAREYPTRRFPLFVVVLILKHLGRKEEAGEFSRLFEEKFKE